MIYVYVFTSADIDMQTVTEVCCPLRCCLIWDLKEIEQNGSHLDFEIIPNITYTAAKSVSVVICLSVF